MITNCDNPLSVSDVVAHKTVIYVLALNTLDAITLRDIGRAIGWRIAAIELSMLSPEFPQTRFSRFGDVILRSDQKNLRLLHDPAQKTAVGGQLFSKFRGLVKRRVYGSVKLRFDRRDCGRSFCINALQELGSSNGKVLVLPADLPAAVRGLLGRGE